MHIITIPRRKVRFLPYISDSLPKGSINTTVVNKNAVGIQLTNTASACRSFAIAGIATITDDRISGFKKAPKQRIKSAVR